MISINDSNKLIVSELKEFVFISHLTDSLNGSLDEILLGMMERLGH